MNKLRLNSGEKVSFRVTQEQKNHLRRLAELNKKTVSDYARDAALSANSNSLKVQNQSLDSDVSLLVNTQALRVL